MLARLREFFEEQSLLEQIEPILREVPVPAEGEVEAYYSANIEKFTEPEKVRVAVILLSVPAWSDESEWDAARDDAAAIAFRDSRGAALRRGCASAFGRSERCKRRRYGLYACGLTE